jgi:hypothetical protein
MRPGSRHSERNHRVITEELKDPGPMARRSNWDKCRRFRIYIGQLGDKDTVIITFEGASREVDAVKNQVIAAVNASLKAKGSTP